MEVADTAADEGANSFEEASAPDVEEFDGLEAGAVEPEASDDEELVDIEYGGKTYQAPKALKGAFLMQADYTRKTQELAAERRALDAAQTRQADMLVLRAGLAAVEQKLAVAKAADLEALQRENPQEAQATRARIAELTATQAQIAEGLGQATAQHGQWEEAQRLAQAERGRADVAREVPGWSPELAQRLGQFALSEFGVTPLEFADIGDARVMRLLHAAYVAANEKGESRQAQRHAESQGSRPAATIEGRAAAGKSPNRMSTDEWMRHRNKQLRAGR